MKNNKKVIMIISIILGVLVLTLGITYAVFSMSRTSSNSKLIVGDVYMHYVDSNKAINLTGAMPSETYDATSFFEFTIDGKNTTTNKDIWYEIILKHGDDATGKTRIKDNLLKFTLTETKNGTTTTVVDGKSYSDLTNKRIWVNKISKGTTNQVDITYRLYMWISNDTIIGTGDVDYTADEWTNVFASIKVDVAGDFNEKVMETDELCFTTTVSNDEVTITDYDKTCGSNVVIPKTIATLPVTKIASAIYSETTNEFEGSFSNKDLSNVTIPDTITSIGSNAFQNNNLSDGEGFIYKRTDTNKDGIAEIDKTTIISYGGSKKDITIPNGVKTIEENAFKRTGLTSVVLPSSVTTIGDAAFSSNEMTSVTFTEGLQTIGMGAFAYNSLNTVTLPNSLISIGRYAFEFNQLYEVIMVGNENNINYIDEAAFYKDENSNPNLREIRITKTCEELRQIPGDEYTDTSYYPWLIGKSPYSTDSVTIYGTGNEVCDAY